MFAVMLSALALAGAPATQITCQQELPGGALGLTYWEEPPRIELSPVGCAATLYASATHAERRKIRALNPHVFFPQVVGQGLLVMLHEAEHVGLGSRDECLVERAAYEALPRLLMLVPELPGAAVQAAQYNTFVLAAYHCA